MMIGPGLIAVRRPIPILVGLVTTVSLLAAGGFPAAATTTLSVPPQPTTAPFRRAAAATFERVAYFRQQSVYGPNYLLKNVETSGAAAQLSTLIYGFENIDPAQLTCFQAVHAASTNPADANAGDGAGDATADYQKLFSAATSVSGKADSSSQALKGNFNQLRELKAKHPNLKILLSIGGPTYSKYYSKAAQTAATRTKFVTSCLDMYIRGNLPTGVGGNSSGGTRSAAGIFDGIDVDWETPAAPGHVGNYYGGQDTANYTALLAEFRSQLDIQGLADKRAYLLTSTVPATPEETAGIDARSIARSLDWADVRAYDLHDARETKGPTNLQAPLTSSTADPAAAYEYNVTAAVSGWIKAGLPAAKLVLGIPFDWRGWTGVSAGDSNGLYQPATGPSPAFPVSATAGVASYRELLAAGKLATPHWDEATQSPWSYDGTTFYTGDTPRSVYAKTLYIRSHLLHGGMGLALDQDDAAGSLIKALTGGLTGTLTATKVTTLTSAPGTGFQASYSCGKGVTQSLEVLDRQGATVTAGVTIAAAVTSDQQKYLRKLDIGIAGSYFVASDCNGVRTAKVPVVVPGSYVALGDGYTSGDGAPGYLSGTDHKGNVCHRSRSGYPFTVQSRKHAGRPLMLVAACGGATVADLTKKNHQANAPEPAQLSWLRPSVGLVTLTLGSNDAGLAAMLKYCGSRSQKAATCQAHSKKAVDAAIKVLGSHDPATKGNLFSAYVAVKTAAPTAQVVVVGYPRLFPLEPPNSGCPTGISGKSFGQVDMIWINAEISRLNAAIKDAVGRAGLRMSYADTADAFADHELCTATPYLNKAISGAAAAQQQSFLPNAVGQRAIAALVVPQVS